MGYGILDELALAFALVAIGLWLWALMFEERRFLGRHDSSLASVFAFGFAGVAIVLAILWAVSV